MSRFSKTVAKILVAFAAVPTFFHVLPVANADVVDVITAPSSSELDARATPKSGNNRNQYVDDFNSSFGGYFFGASSTGEQGGYNAMITIARDVKNVFIAIAVIYLVISVLRLLFSNGGDDDVKKWKNSIVGTTLGIVLMQVAFVFVRTIYDKNVT